MKLIINIFIVISLFACKQADKQVKIEDRLDKKETQQDEPKIQQPKITNSVVKQDTVAPNSEDVVPKKLHPVLKAYQNAKQSSGDEKKQKDLDFLDVFPSSFEEMDLVFGYDDEKGAAPLYSEGRKVIKYFAELPTTENEYYEKFINICINGVWDADNISKGFGIHQRMLSDTENICEVMNKRTDEELKTVFRFIFDGPHPENSENDQLKTELLEKIPDKYQRIERLIMYAYEKLIHEDHDH